MQAIARCNGAVLVEDGKRIGVVQQAGEHLSTAVYCLVLVTIVLGANGVMQLFLHPLGGVGLLLGAGLAGIVAGKTKRALSARDEGPVKDQPWLVFDLEAGQLKNGGGSELGALEGILVRRCVNAFSSSRALCVDVNRKSLVIARGNPFGDSVGDIEDALRKRGINVA